MSLRHWIWLATLELSGSAVHRLLERCGAPERIYEAGEEELNRGIGLQREEIQEILAKRSLEPARQVLLRCAKLGIQVMTLRDAAYPGRLRSIDNPPIVLYFRGTLPVVDDLPCVGVVGTRKAGEKALRTAERFARELAEAGVLIVSGMAAGIDGAAHRGALAASEPTVAVFGCGVDICYPSENRELMDDILASGCVLSEYPPGTKPQAAHFPVRNRIIAGLCEGLLLVSAPQRSGALITARLALEQGRDVFVVPGDIDDRGYEGSNEFLKQGATPVTSPADILQVYEDRCPGRLREWSAPPEPPKEEPRSRPGLFRKKPKPAKSPTPARARTRAPEPAMAEADWYPDLGEQDRRILRAIAEGASFVDQIKEAVGMDTSPLLAALTVLEVEGIISQLPGGYFNINRPEGA